MTSTGELPGAAPREQPKRHPGRRRPLALRTRRRRGWLVRSGAGLVVLAAAAAAPTAAWATASRPPAYESSTVIAPRPPSVADDPVSLYELNADGAQRFLQTQALLVMSPQVVDPAGARLRIAPDDLEDMLEVDTTDEGSALQIKATASSPDVARAASIAVLQEYQRVRWSVARDEARAELATLDRELARQRLLGPAAASAVDSLVTSRARLAVRADAPLNVATDLLSAPSEAEDVSPSPVVRGLVAALVAAAVATTLLVLVRLRRTRAVRVEDLPLPEHVARLGTLETLTDRDHLYRAATALLALPSAPPKTLLVLGSSADALETHVAGLLAQTLRDLGREAGLRRWDDPRTPGSEIDVVDGGWALTLGRAELTQVARADVICLVVAVGTDNQEVLEAAAVVQQLTRVRLGVLLVATQ